MQHFFCNFFTFLFFISIGIPDALNCHGFAGNTAIAVCSQQGTVYLSDICWRAVKNRTQWCIATYDIQNATIGHGIVWHAGTSITPSYLRLTYGDDIDLNTDTIICTPIQEFYLYDTHEWIPAYQLVPGSRLISLDGSHVVISVEHAVEARMVFLIEVQDTHTFFAGRFGLLTHNIGLPGVLNFGLSIPFGAAAGGSFGSFFGPVTMFAGAAIGLAVGLGVKIACGNQMPKYDIGFFDGESQELILSKEIEKTKNKNTPCIGGNGNDNLQPNKPKKDDDKRKLLGDIKGAKDFADDIAEKSRQQVLKESRRLTNKEARQFVKERLFGYEEKPNPPFKTQGNVAFYNKKTNTWISADRDCHNGGVWKMFRGEKREGTFDALLTRRIKD
jgi:hypothetical protein